MNCVGVLLKLLFEECPFTKSGPASRVILLLLFLISFIVHLSYQFGKGVTGFFCGGVFWFGFGFFWFWVVFLSQNHTDFLAYILQDYAATSFLHTDFQEDWKDMISSPIYAHPKGSSHLFK